jgi:hypothetical protein
MADVKNIKVPAGYTEQSADIVGFWTGEGAVHFIPRFVRMFDSSIDPTKSSTLLIADLIDPCEVFKVGEDEERILAGKGQQIGIWTKPGMKALGKLAGIPVYMYQEGEKDIGKPSPMKVYKVMSKGQGQKLIVEPGGDYRNKSLHKREEAPQTNQAPQDLSDDIPF